MAPSRAPSSYLLRSLRALLVDPPCTIRLASDRSFSSTSIRYVESHVAAQSAQSEPDPAIARSSTTNLIGSRRRRAALAESANIPFEQLPYQCFQEARKILIADRAEKLKKIEVERARIVRLREVDPAVVGGEMRKQKRLESMSKELERLKILADVNDPLVKKRFEDGLGDMNKPIYRFLADRKWRSYRLKVIVQRLEQLRVVPDVLPHIDPVVDVRMFFKSKPVAPGDFVLSTFSETPCNLSIQPFTRGEKLVTVGIVDSDVPNVETDSFDFRCHYLACNISISPTRTFVPLAKLPGDKPQVLLPWAPPCAQKGSPYHRLSVVVLEQKDNIAIDVATAAKWVPSHGGNFSMRAFMSRHLLTPIGATVFRTKWDDGMAGVMERCGRGEEAKIELKRTKVQPLKYKRRNPKTFR